MSLTNAMEGVVSMSIYTVLKGEHRKVEGLFMTLENTPAKPSGARRAIFHKLHHELISHAHAEQATVYEPAQQRVRKEDIEEAKREHAQVETLLAELNAMDADTDEWMQKLTQLKNMVQHHVQEEESKVFGEMQNTFSEDEAKEMAKRFREAKNTEMEAMTQAA